MIRLTRAPRTHGPQERRLAYALLLVDRSSHATSYDDGYCSIRGSRSYALPLAICETDSDIVAVPGVGTLPGLPRSGPIRVGGWQVCPISASHVTKRSPRRSITGMAERRCAIARLRKMRVAVCVTCGVGVMALAGCGAVSHTRTVQSMRDDGTRLYAVPATAVVESFNCPRVAVCAPVLRLGKPGIGGPLPNQPTQCAPLVFCCAGARDRRAAPEPAHSLRAAGLLRGAGQGSQGRARTSALTVRRWSSARSRQGSQGRARTQAHLFRRWFFCPEPPRDRRAAVACFSWLSSSYRRG